MRGGQLIANVTTFGAARMPMVITRTPLRIPLGCQIPFLGLHSRSRDALTRLQARRALYYTLAEVPEFLSYLARHAQDPDKGIHG
jgi:hypothetical protein